VPAFEISNSFPVRTDYTKFYYGYRGDTQHIITLLVLLSTSDGETDK
jgi:hypothetical protein